jgi:hypothetical protein
MTRNARDEFLIVGAREFLRASAAIASFGDYVFEAATAAIKKRTGDLTDACGFDFKSAKLKQHQPDGYVARGDDGIRASIGASVALN